MNAHVEIEPGVFCELDDSACSLDDQIAHITRQVMVTAGEIAQRPNQGAFDRLVDQQTRLNDAFNAARRHIVQACEQRSRERLERTLRLVRTS